MSSRRVSEAAGRQWMRDNRERAGDDLQSYAQDLAAGAGLDADWVHEGMTREALRIKEEEAGRIVDGQLQLQKHGFTPEMERQLREFMAGNAKLRRMNYLPAYLRDAWLAAYRAGRVWQFEAVRRLACPDCRDEHPLVEPTGIPLHEVPRPDGAVWRRTCQAAAILPVRPR